MAETPIVALLYDFDKTLCPQDMENYAFIPGVGMEPGDFWEEANSFGRRERMDGILACMFSMVEKSRAAGRPLTRESLREGGKSVTFFPGVESWFGRISEFGASLGVRVEHYVLSSGFREIIEGTSIGGAFTEIFASEFYYDRDGVPVWPRLAVNYTSKTQFVYRINKGILDISDDSVNLSMPDDDRRVPFTSMVFIGDGLTDVPCMKMVRAYGGQSIAVYQDANRRGVEQLLRQGRVDFIFPADYRAGGGLENTVKDIIRRMDLTTRLEGENLRQRRTVESGQ